jgi:hypothetical protein
MSVTETRVPSANGSGDLLRIWSREYVRHPRRVQGLWVLIVDTTKFDMVWQGVTSLVDDQLIRDALVFERGSPDDDSETQIVVTCSVEGYCYTHAIEDWMGTFSDIGIGGLAIYIDMGAQVRPRTDDARRYLIAQLPRGPVIEMTGLGEDGPPAFKRLKL